MSAKERAQAIANFIDELASLQKVTGDTGIVSKVNQSSNKDSLNTYWPLYCVVLLFSHQFVKIEFDFVRIIDRHLWIN